VLENPERKSQKPVAQGPSQTLRSEQKTQVGCKDESKPLAARSRSSTQKDLCQSVTMPPLAPQVHLVKAADGSALPTKIVKCGCITIISAGGKRKNAGRDHLCGALTKRNKDPLR